MSKKKEKYYDVVVDKATKTANILIYGVIGDNWYDESLTAKKLVSEIRNLEKENDRINIRLNSPGGSVFDGLAIYNAISASTKEVHTYNDGVCASMAAVLLLAVKMENIHPAKNSLLMLHSPSTCACGNRKQIENALTVLDKCQKVLVTSICAQTGLDDKEVEKKYFDFQDHWFTADEALTEGFYKQIEDEEAEKVPQNASTMKFSDLIKYFEPKNSILWPENESSDDDDDDEFPDEIFLNIDMDIKKLTAAYKLPEDSTEDTIVAHVAKREQEIADLTTAKTKAETDLTTANQTIAAKDAEIVALKKEPGAKPAGVNNEVDPKTEDEPEGAKDFGSAFAECMDLINPKK